MTNGIAYLWTQGGRLNCRIYNGDGTIDSETDFQDMSPFNLEQLGRGLGKYNNIIRFSEPPKPDSIVIKA